MFNKFDVKIEGWKELQKVIDTLPQNLQDGAMKAGLRGAAKVLIDDAKSRVPVDDGILKRAIGKQEIRTKKHHKNLYIRVGVNNKMAPHGHLVEYGTVSRVQKTTGRETGVMPPHPFMRPSFDSNQQEMLAGFTKRVMQYLRKQDRKVKKRGY